ncbi:hypothetical protein H2201_001689 [Coniosporium apollinis]|uniref:MAGE domain-containing protein n=2 Tax=Coniosporium TaxID=2810619 RepID=A0ABQ9P0Z7_9PEZI|nr:hypothetical protein H2199_007578 [Cladosporium sp. JES 115]KAJ9668259.1 hypothetical protein H2201_001689 [Coniosporium apollinis]
MSVIQNEHQYPVDEKVTGDDVKRALLCIVMLCVGGPEKLETMAARIRQKYNGVLLCPSLLLPVLTPWT